MKRLLVVFICVAGLCQFMACKKTKSDKASAVDDFKFPSASEMPYDTTYTHGIFAAQIKMDTSSATRTCSLNFTAWFTHKVTNGFLDSVLLKVNGRTMTSQGRYFTTNLAAFVPKTGFVPDTSVAWIMTGPSKGGFTYSNEDAFPAYNIKLPDTISAGNHNVFTFSAATLLNADTVVVQLQQPLTADTSVTVAKYYCGPTLGNITLDSTTIKSLAGKSIGVVVSVFSHRSITIDGYKYIFIKEYTFGRGVWFR